MKSKQSKNQCTSGTLPDYSLNSRRQQRSLRLGLASCRILSGEVANEDRLLKARRTSRPGRTRKHLYCDGIFCLIPTSYPSTRRWGSRQAAAGGPETPSADSRLLDPTTDTQRLLHRTQHRPGPRSRSRPPIGALLRLHSIRPTLRRRRGEESHIHVSVLLQLLERGHYLSSDNFFALRGAGSGASAAGFLQVHEGRVVVRKAFEDVDQDGVGFGDVEADVGDGVFDELMQDGEDGAGECGEGEGGREGLCRCQRCGQDFASLDFRSPKQQSK